MADNEKKEPVVRTIEYGFDPNDGGLRDEKLVPVGREPEHAFGRDRSRDRDASPVEKADPAALQNQFLNPGQGIVADKQETPQVWTGPVQKQNGPKAPAVRAIYRI